MTKTLKVLDNISVGELIAPVDDKFLRTAKSDDKIIFLADRVLKIGDNYEINSVFVEEKCSCMRPNCVIKRFINRLKKFR